MPSMRLKFWRNTIQKLPEIGPKNLVTVESSKWCEAVASVKDHLTSSFFSVQHPVLDIVDAVDPGFADRLVEFYRPLIPICHGRIRNDKTP